MEHKHDIFEFELCYKAVTKWRVKGTPESTVFNVPNKAFVTRTFKTPILRFSFCNKTQ